MSDKAQITLPVVEIAERSDPGRDPTKQINEDAYGHRETPFGVLAVVCDGMGGHKGGREASTTAVAAIFEAFESAAPGTPPRDVLRDAVRAANQRVRGITVSDEAAGGRPGSTVVAVLVGSAGTEVAHVGDSRVLLVQQGQVAQLTRDHSMVQEMVAAKLLTPEQALVHPDANRITRALGIDDDVQVEMRAQPIAHVAGDSFVLCSDGLTDLVEVAEILQIVSSDPPAQAVGKLVDLANARGGHDNITVVIVRPHVSAPPPVHGVIAPTRVSTTVTLRPAGLEPAVQEPAPTPPQPARSAPEGPARQNVTVIALALAALTVVGIGGGVALHLAATRPRPTRAAFDAGLAPPPTAASATGSVNLTPTELPQPSVLDASEVAPLEPVEPAPSIRPRHVPRKLAPPTHVGQDR